MSAQSVESRVGVQAEHRSSVSKLTIAALGIVFGDIGTSPLYALRECFHGAHGIALSKDNIFGVLSLIFWSLTLVVSIKYVAYVLRADNKGEGGVLALMALAHRKQQGARATFLLVLGVFGAALLYGDGVITPSISVLSAVEGLEFAAPKLHAFVLPITLAILVGLFAIQSRGTARVGAVFGPITGAWFVALALLGVPHIAEHPEVLGAINPTYAVHFFGTNGWAGILVLGSVFLVVTGGEALYADLGHFGRSPIRRAWFAVVFPALLINYWGQGALLVSHPDAIESPFFRMAPNWALLPLVGLATLATIIASQALISGVYSITSQAAMLGLLPRVRIKHTSAAERGQIYLPTVNWALMLACIGLVLGFQSSSALAAAYGIAVTLTMVITTLLAFFVARYTWGWSLGKAAVLSAFFLVPELMFVTGNVVKIEHGGWFPLVVAAVLFVIMTTWKRGREVMFRRFQEQLVPLQDFFELLHIELPARVPGTAVFMTGSLEGTPPALLHNFTHNRVVHQNVLLLTIKVEEVARVPESERFESEVLEHGFRRLIGRYGFMEQPDVPKLLIAAGAISSCEYASFFLGRENLVLGAKPTMSRWRTALFALLSRNAQPATRFFNIPPDRVVELGSQMAL